MPIVWTPKKFKVEAQNEKKLRAWDILQILCIPFTLLTSLTATGVVKVEIDSTESLLCCLAATLYTEVIVIAYAIRKNRNLFVICTKGLASLQGNKPAISLGGIPTAAMIYSNSEMFKFSWKFGEGNSLIKKQVPSCREKRVVVKGMGFVDRSFIMTFLDGILRNIFNVVVYVSSNLNI
ncbi:unnamed protein product [Orchesella dallaii]|uniref:Uncharacterized protein n=1 Tax=Orchesella dallaii TaxID=48710 RepID=A0ABP1RMK6_9HEXA